jgi:hypothetical protein
MFQAWAPEHIPQVHFLFLSHMLVVDSVLVGVGFWRHLIEKVPTAYDAHY